MLGGPPLYQKLKQQILKTTAIGLGPIESHLYTFLGFPVKTLLHADTQLTVLLCCQFVVKLAHSAI
jgi:hypothetical protein